MIQHTLRDGLISIDYVKLEMNLVNPLTIPLQWRVMSRTSRGIMRFLST
ncbi:hypothetical protein MTR67_022783 [Solanum verrucosum]|uniref:Uncharacterized protein n=1 Tax=Solanum verrucosum TaxID=315347 RepID=A0AAF0QU39_SOLVR|nr:hypothetical protein MTR67_022783 [Solanum verrucosum]